MTEVVLALRGRARNQWLWWSQSHSEPTWDTFTTIFLWRFKPEQRHILPVVAEEEEPDQESMTDSEAVEEISEALEDEPKAYTALVYQEIWHPLKEKRNLEKL